MRTSGLAVTFSGLTVDDLRSAPLLLVDWTTDTRSMALGAIVVVAVWNLLRGRDPASRAHSSSHGPPGLHARSPGPARRLLRPCAEPPPEAARLHLPRPRPVGHVGAMDGGGHPAPGAGRLAQRGACCWCSPSPRSRSSSGTGRCASSRRATRPAWEPSWRRASSVPAPPARPRWWPTSTAGTRSVRATRPPSSASLLRSGATRRSPGSFRRWRRRTAPGRWWGSRPATIPRAARRERSSTGCAHRPTAGTAWPAWRGWRWVAPPRPVGLPRPRGGIDVEDRSSSFCSFSYLVLLLLLRSVFLPLKAVLMNLLSVGAAYGVLVAVFQWDRSTRSPATSRSATSTP